ncbi:MAG: glucose 1-dehydrogenase [Thermoanaerobaculales bacterium]|nr:glucose 1-dehydrogenase [Thermoanaerobaculales bacterium]
MDLGLTDKVALVTGGSRGLGWAMAASLAAEGARVAICARNQDRLAQAAEKISAAGGEVFPVGADVTDVADRNRLLTAVKERFGPVDVLVNNVGGNRRGMICETTDEDWHSIIDLNLMSHVQLARDVIPSMRERRRGVILFVASIFGREFGGPGMSIYHTTKSALIGLAKALALELAPDGIRVNSIAPGSIRFPGGSWDRRCEEEPEKMAEFIAANIPMGRFGHAHEIGDVVAFLVSDRAAWITGACLNVDGGQSRSLI